MTAITKQDYENIFESVGKLYECDSAENYARIALAEISRLVGCDRATFNYVAPTIPKITVIGISPESPGQQTQEQKLARYVADQPVLKHYLATGDVWAYKISDFLSVREYHSLPLYEQVYRDLGCEDQFAFMLFPPGSELISVSLARSRRNFTERDRQILNLLRPCIARTYRRVEHLERMKPTRGASALPRASTRVTTVLLNAEHQAIRFGNGAEDWISHFFPESSASSSGLPDKVSRWLYGDRSVGAVSERNSTLFLEREDQRLRLRLIPGLREPERIMILDLQSASGTAEKPAAKKLTHREIEVLLEVEQGKSNDEIGVALGISSLTVRTHLEHIFQKLKVPCRTAAVTQFRRLCEIIVLAAWWLQSVFMNSGLEIQDAAI